MEQNNHPGKIRTRDVLIVFAAWVAVAIGLPSAIHIYRVTASAKPCISQPAGTMTHDD